MPYHTFLAFLQIREETLDVYRNNLTLFAYDVQGIRKMFQAGWTQHKKKTVFIKCSKFTSLAIT